MPVEGLLHGIMATWLACVLVFFYGVPYPLPLRGYISFDVSVIPTPSMSGAQGTTST